MKTEYHKIQTVFKRDLKSNFKTMLDGQWTLPELEYLSNNIWEYTEKVDGTNIRVNYTPENNKLKIDGKTDNADLPKKLTTSLFNIFDSRHNKFKEIFTKGTNITLYGEGYNKQGQGFDNFDDFIVFDVNIDGWWLSSTNITDISNKLNILRVPIIGRGTLFDAINLTQKGIQSQVVPGLAEGIVARPLVELKTRSNHRIITKIKTIDFLKKDENESRHKRSS
jgi:hypothetical protein